MNYIAETLRTAYEKKDVSYEALAKACNVSRATIQRYVMGITKRIDVEKLTAICNVLDVDVSRLIGYDKNSPYADVSRNFGKLLKRAQDENNLSFKQMAELLQIPEELLQLYESGERIPAYPVASAWAISLGIPVEEYDPLYGKRENSVEVSPKAWSIARSFDTLTQHEQDRLEAFLEGIKAGRENQ